MRVVVARPGELGAQEAQRWAALQAGDPELSSPYFSLAWAKLVDCVRPDARVAVIEDAGEIVGFLPVQRLSAFTAMPIGAPVNDAQGLIAAPNAEIEWPAVLAALKVERFDFSALRMHQAALRPYHRAAAVSWHAFLGDGWGAYVRLKRNLRQEGFKKANYALRRFYRDAPGAAFHAFSADAKALNVMINWKRAQYRRTGQTDILARPWVDRLLRAAAEMRGPDLEGALFVLESAGAPAAVTFCLRRGPVLHTWFTAYDPAFEKVGPGVANWRAMVEAAAGAGVRILEMGPGDYQYKRALATHGHELAEGFVARPSTSGLVRSAAWDVRSVLERTKWGALARLPGKAMRRWDMWRALGR